MSMQTLSDAIVEPNALLAASSIKRMHAGNHVAIVANGGGLPAGP